MKTGVHGLLVTLDQNILFNGSCMEKWSLDVSVIKNYSIVLLLLANEIENSPYNVVGGHTLGQSKT